MRKILLTLISFVALSALVACGGGSSNNNIGIPSSPSGGNPAGFSNASLSGNYVYAVSGLSANNSFAVAGVFTADGNGNVTSGVRDTVNDAGGQTLNEAITGNYSVNQDGRGQMILNGGSGQSIYRFVLQSTTSLQAPVVAKLFQDGTTNNSVVLDAVGTIEAQASPTLAGTSSFAVRLDGEDAGGNGSIYGAVGNLILSGGGVSGTIDENDDGGFNGLLGVSSGSYSFAGNGRGTLSYVTPGSTAATAGLQGTHSFVAYLVTPNHFELLSTDKKFWLHGSADLQSATVSANTAAFTGNQVFSLSGADSSGQRVETGRLNLDGAGNLTSAIEDVNNASNFFSGVSLSSPGSSYTVTGPNGRWTANLVNTPTAGSTTGIVGWQVSPQRSVVLAWNAGSTLLETGTMRAQTIGLGNASVTGNYAQELSGINSSSNSDLELVGNLLADGAGNLSGTFDSQSDSSGLFLDDSTTGTYAVDPVLGRSTSGNIDGIPVVIYTLDPNTIYFISAQQFDIYQGMMVHQ